MHIVATEKKVYDMFKVDKILSNLLDTLTKQ